MRLCLVEKDLHCDPQRQRGTEEDDHEDRPKTEFFHFILLDNAPREVRFDNISILGFYRRTNYCFGAPRRTPSQRRPTR